jgi:hypothetical protein
MIEMPPVDVPFQSHFNQQLPRRNLINKTRLIRFEELKEDPFSFQKLKIEEEKKKNDW